MHFVPILLLFLCSIKEGVPITCYCNDRYCDPSKKNGDCEGEYCYVIKLLAQLPPKKYGCITTRQDLTDFGCEQNYKGGITCVCKEDYCNTEQLAVTSVKENKTTVLCHVESSIGQDKDQSVRPEDRPVCRGAYCYYEQLYNVNKFGDFTPMEVYKRCSFITGGEREHVTSLSALNWQIDVNEDACVIVQTPSDRAASKICKCSTDYCNENPPFDVKIGSKSCYLYDSERGEELSYCKGDYCFWTLNRQGNNFFRGCMSVTTASRTPLKTFKTTVGLSEVFICDVELCNGEPLTKSANENILVFYFGCIILLCFL